MNNIAFIFPTLYRAVGLERALRSLYNTMPRESVDFKILVVAEADDKGAPLLCARFGAQLVVCPDPLRGPAYAWNMGLKHAKFFDSYFLGSDDIEFRNLWFEELVAKLNSELRGSGLVACNDGRKSSSRIKKGEIYPTQYLMTRDFVIDHNGGVLACPHYRVDFVDVETCLRAQRANKFAYAENSFVFHHWRQQDDFGYKNADKHRDPMRAAFENRLSKGFPDDFERII